ncbi:MAG: metallopeptidase family protein [Acidimicrobiia bacterium]|nr:metallopeptidase family protein [Acidimicrobiia bacterium]
MEEDHTAERAFAGEDEAFGVLVDGVLESLPAWVIERLDNLIVVVDDLPPADSPDLLGLYEGVSLLERSGEYTGAMPDQITVFRRTHLEVAATSVELAYEVRRTVLHEIGHYLGFTEARLHELGWD